MQGLGTDRGMRANDGLENNCIQWGTQTDRHGDSMTELPQWG